MGPPRVGSAASPVTPRPVPDAAPARAATPPPVAPADPSARHVDAFEPTAAASGTEVRPASRLERSPAFERLTPDVQARVRELGTGASPSGEANLSRVVSARGFSDLTVERQREMLDAYARHPEDRRVATGLAHLAGSRDFRESDAAAQSTEVRRTATPPRLRGDALEVLNTTTPQHITVNGVPIDVYGASPSELETIQTTLGRLPPSHLRTIPRVVVGDTIGHGNNERGGAWVPQRSIDAYEARGGGARNAAAYRAEGWTNPPRLELTHESLGRRDVESSHVSPTILHETGHAVDERYHLSGGMSPESLGRIDYNGGTHAGPEDLGPVNERFADGYMHYYLGSLRGDPVAYPTISHAIDSVPE